MVKLQRVYLFSRKDTLEHPVGDGWRNLLVFPSPDGAVQTVSTTAQHAKVFSRAAWDAMRPLDVDFDTAAMHARLTTNAKDMARLGVAYEIEPVERALTLLAAMLAPPPAPRIRTRARASDLSAA